MSDPIALLLACAGCCLAAAWAYVSGVRAERERHSADIEAESKRISELRMLGATYETALWAWWWARNAAEHRNSHVRSALMDVALLALLAPDRETLAQAISSTPPGPIQEAYRECRRPGLPFDVRSQGLHNRLKLAEAFAAQRDRVLAHAENADIQTPY